MADTKVIVIPEGKICDYIDGKFRNDTPEEYVRQTVEKRLVNEHKYFPEQIRVEYTLQLGSRKPRADIVIFESKDTAQTQENIKIIIECKKETVDARNAKDGVEQLKSYMSACPNCEWGMWTNGRQMIFRLPMGIWKISIVRVVRLLKTHMMITFCSPSRPAIIIFMLMMVCKSNPLFLNY